MNLSPFIKFIFLILCYFLCLNSAYAQVEDLGTTQVYEFNLCHDKVRKDFKFCGDNINLMGYITNDVEAVIVVIKGPIKHFQIWKKEERYGIWTKTSSLTLPLANTFFMLFSSDYLDRVSSKQTLNEIGVLPNYGIEYSNHDNLDNPSEFINAFIEERQSKELYKNNLASINMQDNMFSCVIDIPEFAPSGEYVITAYYFKNKRLIASRNKIFHIKEVGFIDKLKNFSMLYPFLYASIGVSISLLWGWLVARMFR